MNPVDRHPHTTAPIALRVRKLDPRAAVPTYQSEHAAGMDLAACLPEGETITLTQTAPGSAIYAGFTPIAWTE